MREWKRMLTVALNWRKPCKGIVTPSGNMKSLVIVPGTKNSFHGAKI